MSGEVIEIEYQLTVDDYAKFNADFHCTPLMRKKHLKAFFWTSVYCLFLFEYIFYLSFRNKVREGELNDSDIYQYHLDIWFSSTGLVLVLIFIFAYWLCFSKSRIRKRNYLWVKKIDDAGQNKALLASKKIIMSENNVIVLSCYFKCDYKWSGFEKVEILNGDLCIFHSVRSALIIPSRYFKSEEEKQRVYAQCVAWFEAAREKAA